MRKSFIKELILLVLISPVTLFFYSCSDNNDKSDAYGNFEATEITVSSSSDGRLLVFNVEEGQALEKGDVVGYVDTMQLHLRKSQLLQQKQAIESRYATVIANVNILQQRIENNLVEKRRVQNLLKSEAVPEKSLDDINAGIDILQREIEATRTQNKSILEEIQTIDVQVQQVKDLIQKNLIINPVKGTVLVKFAQPSEMTGPGRPLYKIADTDEMVLRVYVSGAQLPGVETGRKVKVLVDKDAESNRMLEGEISWISSKAEFTPKIIQTKDERVNLVYAVKVRVKNDGTLKIGMPGEIVFTNNADQ